MKNTTLYLILLSAILFSCEKNDTNPSITSVLENQNEITIIKTEELENGEELITFKIKQPLNHDNPKGPYFIQNGTLLHRNYNLPIVFMPSGYGRSTVRQYNLTQCTFSKGKHSGKPNILAVDHRYYGNDGKDFEDLDPAFLNIEQAANDLHQIVQIFKKAYKSQWISMGYSKGGRTCIYHKYYYPEDVNATLSFVAPITLQEADNRFYDFIKNIHTDEEYQSMIEFQRLLLQKRDELSVLLENWYQDNELEMDRESDKVIEGIALGYPFTYWQYKSFWLKEELSILNAPTIDANANDIFEFLSATYFLDSYSTRDMVKYAPYYYQSRTQTGYPLYGEYEKLSDLLKYYKTAGKNEYSFDPKPVQNVIDLLDKDGNNIIHFYGSKDPWTAAMYNALNNDALTLMKQGGDHLIDLYSTMDRAISKLQDWTGYEIDLPTGSVISALKSKDYQDWIKEEYITPIIPNR